MDFLINIHNIIASWLCWLFSAANRFASALISQLCSIEEYFYCQKGEMEPQIPEIWVQSILLTAALASDLY